MVSDSATPSSARELPLRQERAAGKGSPAPRRPVSEPSVTKERHQESAASEETKPKAPVTYQVSEQPSPLVQEKEFAKQLRLARYLAAGGSPPSRPLEPVRHARTPKPARPVAKPGAKAKVATVSKKAREEELAKERRRAGRVGHKLPASGSGRGEKQRPERGR
jgi:hypothetical protein